MVFLIGALIFLALAVFSYATTYCITNLMEGAEPYCPNKIWTIIFSAVTLVSFVAFAYVQRKK